MTDSREPADPGQNPEQLPGDVEPAVDEIFAMLPEETPEDVIALADREEPDELTEEAVFSELASELSTSTETTATASETTPDVPAVDDLFGGD